MDVDVTSNNAESNLQLLALVDQRPVEEERRSNIVLPESLLHEAAKRLKKWGYSTDKTIVGFHPGCKATWSFKRWPAGNFAQLIKAVKKRLGAQVILFGGPDEFRLSKQLMHQLDERPLNLIGKLNLKETFCTISLCDLFVSNDSGLMHMAAVLGVPVVALFGGHSNEVLTGPYGPNHTILKSADIKDISVEVVFEAVRDHLTRRCGAKG